MSNNQTPDRQEFDEHSPSWTPNAEYNYMFVQSTQNYINHKMNSQGFVFLNDVFEALGLNKTARGQVMGWMNTGDNNITFVPMAHDFADYKGNPIPVTLDFPNVEYILDVAFQ